MRLSDRVYLFASGAMGVNLSHPNDCNAFAIDCGGEFVLVDCGVGRQTDVLLDNLTDDGIDLGRVRHLFITHGHLDHSGGASALQKELDLRLYSSGRCAAFLESGDEAGISLQQARTGGIYGEDFELFPVKVDCFLGDRETVKVGDVTVEAISTPGHSCDLVSLLVNFGDHSDLFPGDTVFHGGRILLSAVYDCDVQDCIASLRKLRGLKCRGLFPGHGLWSLENGGIHIESANLALDRLLLPANLM